MQIIMTIDFSNGTERRFSVEAENPRAVRVVDILSTSLAGSPAGPRVELTSEGTDRGGGLFGWIKSIDGYPFGDEPIGHWAVWIGPVRISRLFSGFNSDLPVGLSSERVIPVLLKFVSETRVNPHEELITVDEEANHG